MSKVSKYSNRRFTATKLECNPSVKGTWSISAKYCWFGWWLGAWSTPSHHPTQLCDKYISGYIYTFISEWTRLFGLLRILDYLISGAVCYFLYDCFCILWNIHLTHARSCSCRHTLSWVGFFFMPSSGVGLVSVPITFRASSNLAILMELFVNECKRHVQWLC